ncbi:MAG: DUF3822 family protein [Paludibacteraceae bacterium]|nr:DUF3822 family protein [Paludibacteraceae bacterium]
MDQKPVANNQQYSLSIRFFPDGFSLFVSDSNHKTIVSRQINAEWGKLNSEEILEILSGQQEFNMNFGQIRLIVESSFYSVIPSSVHNPEHKKTFLSFLFPQMPGNFKTLHNDLLPWAAIIIFSIPQALHDALESILPEIVIEHHLSAFMSDHVPLSTETTFYVFCRNEIIDIMLFVNGKPMTINSYKSTSETDLLYYAMRNAELYNIDPHQTPLKIFNINEKNNYNATLEKHFLTCETTTEA